MQRLTTAFFGFACSWDISSSCSGVHTRTLLSTLNQPLHRKTQVRGTSDSIQIQTVMCFMSSPPCILWRLSKHLISSLVRHDIQRVLLLVIIHNLPVRRQTGQRETAAVWKTERAKKLCGNLTLQLGCRWFPSASPRCRCRSTSACCPSVQTSASSSF